MDDPKLPSHDSSISLIARLDHLEFIMKYLERKQRCGSNVPADKGKQFLDLATKEAFYKGTLLDRVASLEHRLFKQGFQDGNMLLIPTFNNLPNNAEKGLVPTNHIRTPEILQEKPESEQQQIINSCPPKQQLVKNRPKKDEKKCKVEKKRTSPVSWPHLKLLGC
ncbi:hypothetical protein E2542_SST06290 [Spatholobus suberectus]|nr:hypothetical protein E2542_SST06290 [Spatholobus suberectus]